MSTLFDGFDWFYVRIINRHPKNKIKIFISVESIVKFNIEIVKNVRDILKPLIKGYFCLLNPQLKSTFNFQ